jgi:hypothetical protein
MEEGQTEKFSCVLMFNKQNAEHMSCLQALYQQCQQVFNERWGATPEQAPQIPMQGHDSSPIKDGDVARNRQGFLLSEKNPEYAGHYIIRAANTSRPRVVDRNLQDILEPSLIYGGCLCKVNVNAYTFNKGGNKGVTFGLNGVQFWADEESFGAGHLRAEQMFEAAGAEDPANYGGANPFAGAPMAAPVAPPAAAPVAPPLASPVAPPLAPPVAPPVAPPAAAPVAAPSVNPFA